MQTTGHAGATPQRGTSLQQRPPAPAIAFRSITPVVRGGSDDRGLGGMQTPGRSRGHSPHGDGASSVPVPPQALSFTPGLQAAGQSAASPKSPRNGASFGALAAVTAAEAEHVQKDSRLINKVAANVKQIAELQKQVKELQLDRAKLQEQEEQRSASLRALLDEAKPFVAQLRERQLLQGCEEDGEADGSLQARLGSIVAALKAATSKALATEPLTIHVPEVHDHLDCLLAAKLLRLDVASQLGGLSVTRLAPSLYRFAGLPVNSGDGGGVKVRCHSVDGHLLVCEEENGASKAPVDLRDFLTMRGCFAV